MGPGMNLLFIFCLLASIYRSNGCTMEGVTIWQLPITVTIEDYFDGIILQRAVSDIGGFTLTSYNDLNGGPYVNAAIEDSSFVLRTNDAYRLFEENETEDRISLTYTFSCTNGVSLPSPLTIIIEINDNNNNNPLFKTPDTAASADTTYSFTIAPPVPPGFLITNCVSDIIVRDIDLTTYRIDFGIEDNPYFEIEYDEASSTVAKEFKAVLRTTAFIRSVPEPIVLTISATDVDLTGDPPITTYTTVTIHGSAEFELPQEPVFSQAYYFANYTEDNQIVLEQSITLQQGYDEEVQFSLEGDYAAAHFALNMNGNDVSLSVTNPLPVEVLQQGQIYLVVNAVREYTSGASATIVVQLPEAVELEFEQTHYEGEIVDNTLQPMQLLLTQGYQGSVITATVEDYSTFFTASAVGNIITLSMTTPLDENIIQDNSFINLRVTASTDSSSITTIVTLEIVKDDVTTPVFGQALYTGTYDTNLIIDAIVLVQGYDETVTVSLSGEHDSYFELIRNGASSTLQLVENLPSHILSEGHLLLTVEAAKPRTVGATAVVSITLPEARELRFEASTYKGSLQDSILAVDNIILNVGYDEDVMFSLSGDYSTLFAVSNAQNQVTITLPAQLPEAVISENNFILLTLTATGTNAVSATTTVLLEIIKDDVTTPVFSQPIYYGTYLGSLDIDIGNINLVQGYDDSVTFRIEGENSGYFAITQNQNVATLSVQSSIPEEVILSEKMFVFNIVADKPLTVGANAAIAVKFSEELTEPAVLRFTNNTYVGSLEDDSLILSNIVLETGFAAGTQFVLSGDHASYFTQTISNNVVTLSITSSLPTEVLENKFIVLELEARRDRAVSAVATIVVEIVEEEIVIPVFSQAYYSGIYTEENTLQFEETITLQQGYDDTVTFGLEGESAEWFAVSQSGNSATIVSTAAVPQDVLENYHHLIFTVVAYKPNTINAVAAISIDLPKDILEQEVLRFAQSSYEGQIDGSALQVPTITLTNEITENIEVSLSGAYATYFTVTHDSNVVRIELANDLPTEVTDNEYIIIDITASKPDAVSGHATLVLSIVKEPAIVTPVFEQAYYTGEILNGDLVFEHTMRLIQGFDETISFTLNGDGSERFNLMITAENSLSLSIAEGGTEQIEDISNLVFSIVASKTGSVSGEAAIVIHNMNSSTARYLRFSQNHYRGSLEENTLTVESISLVEGYGPGVQFQLSGDYWNSFQLVGADGTYALQLTSDVTAEDFEENILVLSIEAFVDDARTHATIVIELIKDDNIENEALEFDETYYTGSYSAISGVMDDIQLRVVSGYDSNTVFTLEEGVGEWLNVQHSESNVIISLVAPPPIELFINQPLIFALNAVNSAGRTTSATIVVTLEDELPELTLLRFERNSYVGTIESSTSNLETITLIEGYSPEVNFTLKGDLSEYFTIIQQDSTVTVILQGTIPDQVIPANRIIVLELEATSALAVSATTTIVLEVVAGVDPIFEAGYYIGQYTEIEGLMFDSIISLQQGYDQDVQFALEGEHAQWFALQVQGNSVTLTTSGAIPPAILVNNQQLVFMVTAQKPNSNAARATIVISLVEDYTVATILGFERPIYVGAIENDIVSLDPIVLTEGYSDTVTFTLHGDLALYFSLQQQGSTINIVLQSAIPEDALPANRVVIIEVRAAAAQSIPATTIVMLETQQAVTNEQLTFEAAYYVGQYSETGGLVFDTAISLQEGFDQDVQFGLEGDHAQWFALQIEGNSVTLTTSGAIPPAILVNNQQLVFIVTAQKPNSNVARATVVISLLEDYTDATILGFERPIYVGAIENDIVSLDPIVLTEGYSDTVTFTLHGDLTLYFSLQQQGSTINIVLQSAIPEDNALPANRVVIMEVRAAAAQSIPATTIVMLEAQQAVTSEQLAFEAVYYVGQYSETGGLVFDTAISLQEGYDQDVQFGLEGDHAQWFALQIEGNSVTLTISGAIPPAILVNNQQLVFIVTAQKPNSNVARATVVISLVEDYTDATVLGFERPIYVGAIENDIVSLDPIVLTEGYSDTVTFTLHGDLALYFSLQQQGSTINIVLQSAIPEDALPANRVVIMEVRAAAAQSIPATTAVVLETQQAVTSEQLAFEAAYYVGQYSETGGLVFNTAISLQEGYDQDVQFGLEGDHAQWFALQIEGNSVTLTTSGAIPPAILVNNQQLVFIVTAQKPNSNVARATVLISLVEDYTDATILGFERPIYVGAIENDIVSLDPIVLTEGYSDTVTFTLHGDLALYFSLQQQGSTINIVLHSTISEDALPANGVVIIEVRAAAAQSIPATTIVMLEAQQAVTSEQLAFEAAYYVGQYSETGGLVFDTAISLQEGYDQDVQFGLEGDHAQWFDLQVEGNSVTLTTSGAIPPAILVNNQQLVFIVTAQKPNSNVARATVVISLVEDYTDATILGFERPIYVGAIENDIVSLDPIVLTEGYSDTVTFTLHGDLALYFSLQQQGSTINIVLQSTIPEDALSVNGVVIIEVRAAAAQSIPATTIVMLEAQQAVTSEQLAFEAAYYIGQYIETGGLVFDTAISLQDGYDQDVRFGLEGDHAQWFALQIEGNSVTLTTSGAIPPAILVNNQQLVFIVTAQKPNSNVARATVVISLVEDYTDATVLSFERPIYVGAIENDIVSLDPIVLTEGYSDTVTFTLHGDLALYFSLQQQGSTINIVLQSAIPEDALPANRVVTMEVRAAAAQSIPASTIVMLEAQQAVTSEQLAFEAAYYVGQYSETGGLVLDTAISLQEGYDQDVQFGLEGDHAQWFALQIEGNSVTLTTSGAIPPAILVNNQQLVFIVTAQKPNSNVARATVVISLVEDYTDATVLGFERPIYVGAIENDIVSLDPIVLTEGYSDTVTFTLNGDLALYFSLQQQGSTINIVLQSAIPEDALPANRVVIIEVRAVAAQSIPATTIVMLETQQAVTNEQLTFEAAYYVGQYSETGGLVFDTAISLQEGFDQDVQFGLEGDHAQWFDLQVEGNSVTLTTSGAIPPAILVNNQQLVFIVTAQKPNSNVARATVVISLVEDYTDAIVLGFERPIYVGAIENDIVSLDPIVLTEGYSDTVTFTLHGDLALYFSLQQQGSTINIVLQSAIPEDALPANRVVTMEVRAAAAQSIPASTIVMLEAQQAVTSEQLAFEAAYYVGQYSETGGLVFDTAISLQDGYDQDVQFGLEGDHAQWFALQAEGNSVTLTTSGAIPPAILVNNQQLVFIVTAQKPNSNVARVTVVISLVDDYTDATVLGFERPIYVGAIENDIVSLDPIVLTEGYSDTVTFTLHGDLALYFSLQQQGSTINIVLQSAIPEDALPANRVVIMEVRAAAAQSIPATTIVMLEAQQAVTSEQLAFEAAYYVGQYSETGGLVFDTAISLQDGYDQDVQFGLEGDHAQWFALQIEGNSVTLTTSGAIPPAILVNNQQLVFIVTALKPNSNVARATVVISLIDGTGSETIVAFDKVLYEGTITLNVVQHEPITISEYTGSDVEILGVYRDLFSATVSDGTVVVGASGALGLPDDVTHVALELRAGGASAVLVFDVIQSVTPELPTVTFGSPNYVLRADMSQTGLVGQVQATASNGETVVYSLTTNDAHLQERVSINSEGEINLSAPTNTGVYNFQVTATTLITQVQATATVQLTVEAASTCGDDLTLPPLIILDRDEEEPHDNLVVLDSVSQAGCQFTLTNRWPADQDWLFVNDTGLHARTIDREDPRIAFMALSQVQVELVLECTSDTRSRFKRSTDITRLDWLGPYEYGSNKWILTDTIFYNSRRSFVNLIVNDINDNYPIFVGKENEPIVCGYPIPDLEGIVLPRALAELKATDADVGENAALAFWSSEEVLAVSPATGSVHVRNGATLEQDQLLTVSVTDLNGSEDGLTANIQLLVKLIDTSHIVVVTVRNAFLDQEQTILGNLSSAVGYEVKVLSSAVVSDDPADSENTRNKREVTDEGASLQLYVYGVIDREPVAVDQLKTDITDHVLEGVDVTSTVSLEDYLEGREIVAGRDVGLLVATIVLSVLLFILILAIAVWFFLRWRKGRNYEQFSDANSIASRSEPLEQPPKVDTLKKPRLNIEELKRSERRLQEMLDAPVDDAAKAQTSQKDPEDTFDTLINMSPPETTLPIVIQSIDKLKDDSGDEDEFGERTKKARRKSVVTFNENVEKIIHVEDIPDDSSDVEVFKF